jgi:hypothetical protein
VLRLSAFQRDGCYIYLNEFVFRYNRRFYRHVSFETLLGLAARRAPTSYWDIAGRPNPRKGKLIARRKVAVPQVLGGMAFESGRDRHSPSRRA